MKPDDHQRDADAAASTDDASMPACVAVDKVGEILEKPADGKTTDREPDSDASATVATDAVLGSVASIIPATNAPPIAVPLTDPVAAVIPVIAPPVVAAAVPQPAIPTPPAPLAIAAAGIAAAKVASQTAGMKTFDAGAGTTKTATAADTSDQIPTPPPAAPADEIVSAPTIAVHFKTVAAVVPETGATPGDPSLAKAASSEAPKIETTVSAPAIDQTAPKPDAPLTDAKPKPALTEPDAAAPTAAPKQPHEQRAASSVVAPTIDAPSSIVAPVTTHSSTHNPAAVTATAQLTATVATAAPVPLNGLAVELASRAQSGASRFDIRLDPAELGRIDVRIDIDRNGQVTSHLTVEKPETLAMLRQDSPQLQRALNDAGLKTPDGSLQFSLGDQSQPRQNTGGGEQQTQRFIIRDDETIPSTAPVQGYGRMPAARSGVDISV